MKNKQNVCRCVIAGGGTGGHLFPGIAIAMELERRHANVEILFVVGRRRMESEILARYGYRTAFTDVEGIKGRGWKKGMDVLIGLPKNMLDAAAILRGFSPSFALGMGAYSAGPICLAAKLMGIPAAIHEQNSYPGLTNRLLSRFVDRVFISFAESSAYFKAGSTTITGNPVRHELLSDQVEKDDDLDTFTVLVLGGSQGARAISEAFVEALACLDSKGKRPHVVHQAGTSDYQRTVKDYQDRGVEGEVIPFIEDMAAAYNQADLVVSRAGATTIFELAAMGKPAILIPYPYASNQHQEINARCLAGRGGAEMIRQKDLTGEGLAQTMMRYMDDRAAVKEMGKRARGMARADAAKAIVDELLQMTGFDPKKCVPSQKVRVKPLQ